MPKPTNLSISYSLILISMFLANILCFNLFPAWTTYSTYGLLFFANLLTLLARGLQVATLKNYD